MKEITTHGVKRIIFALGMLVSLLQATPCRAEQVYEIDLIKYSITDELNHEVMVAPNNYKLLNEETTIPTKVTIDGQEYTVTAIGDDAFIKNTSIKFLTLPETITRIGNRAFQECTKLKSVNLPDAITEIGEAAFSESGLETVVFPPLVEEIKDYTFYKCKITGVLVIPETVKKIGKYAFAGYNKISSVTFPSSVTEIQEGAFSECEYLNSVNLNVVEEIGNKAFYMCQYIENLEIPSSVRSIGNQAFYSIKYIRDLEIPSSVRIIGDEAFSKCEILENLVIKSRDLTIGDKAFFECRNLNSVELPESGSIRYGAYALGRTAFKTAPLNNSIVSIGDFAFYECPLMTARIPASVEHLGLNIFLYCELLFTINVDENNKNYCSRGNVIYTKDMTTLVVCPMTKSRYEMPATVTVIAKYAMYQCGFYYFKISENLKIIDDYGMNCGITETPDGNGILKLPNSVTRIGVKGLSCYLKRLYLRAEVQELGKDALSVGTDCVIYCFAQNPPRANVSLGCGPYLDLGCILYVLKGCRERYLASEIWKRSFLAIYELDRSDIEDIESDRTAIPAEYFNLRGVKVSPDAMAPGYYIKRQGSHSEKILVK